MFVQCFIYGFRDGGGGISPIGNGTFGHLSCSGRAISLIVDGHSSNFCDGGGICCFDDNCGDILGTIFEHRLSRIGCIGDAIGNIGDEGSFGEVIGPIGDGCFGRIYCNGGAIYPISDSHFNCLGDGDRSFGHLNDIFFGPISDSGFSCFSDIG